VCTKAIECRLVSLRIGHTDISFGQEKFAIFIGTRGTLVLDSWAYCSCMGFSILRQSAGWSPSGLATETLVLATRSLRFSLGLGVLWSWIPGPIVVVWDFLKSMHFQY
jgi:hypothetical protein